MRNARELTIKGDLTAAEDMTVDFAIDGSLELSGHRLVVTEGGAVSATVSAASVIVRGRLDGHIAADRLEIGPSAVVMASVVAPRIALHEGALLSGPVNTERAQAAGKVARHRQRA
jgi:cytoskeletal protein CcmA (bactofilin family)